MEDIKMFPVIPVTQLVFSKVRPRTVMLVMLQKMPMVVSLEQIVVPVIPQMAGVGQPLIMRIQVSR